MVVKTDSSHLFSIRRSGRYRSFLKSNFSYFHKKNSYCEFKPRCSLARRQFHSKIPELRLDSGIFFDRQWFRSHVVFSMTRMHRIAVAISPDGCYTPVGSRRSVQLGSTITTSRFRMLSLSADSMQLNSNSELRFGSRATSAGISISASSR